MFRDLGILFHHLAGVKVLDESPSFGPVRGQAGEGSDRCQAREGSRQGGFHVSCPKGCGLEPPSQTSLYFPCAQSSLLSKAAWPAGANLVSQAGLALECVYLSGRAEAFAKWLSSIFLLITGNNRDSCR